MLFPWLCHGFARRARPKNQGVSSSVMCTTPMRSMQFLREPLWCCQHDLVRNRARQAVHIPWMFGYLFVIYCYLLFVCFFCIGVARRLGHIEYVPFLHRLFIIVPWPTSHAWYRRGYVNATEHKRIVKLVLEFACFFLYTGQTDVS